MKKNILCGIFFIYVFMEPRNAYLCSWSLHFCLLWKIENNYHQHISSSSQHFSSRRFIFLNVLYVNDLIWSGHFFLMHTTDYSCPLANYLSISLSILYLVIYLLSFLSTYLLLSSFIKNKIIYFKFKPSP